MAPSRNPYPTLLLVLLAATSAVAARFSPSDNFLLSCGSTAATALPDGRRFIPDGAFLATSSRSHRISTSSPSAAASGDGSQLYVAARLFPNTASYVFPIRAPGTHLLRLHFSHSGDASAVVSRAAFHVAANGFALLADFSVPGPAVPIVKEFVVPIHADKLVLTFAPSRGGIAFVSAIEVIAAPADLIEDLGTLVSPTGVVGGYTGLSSQVLETLYRITVGGPKVTPFNDSLWRTWVPDEGFLSSDRDASNAVFFAGKIQYLPGGASREVAPDNVYRTARAMKDPSLRYMTWDLPVDSGSTGGGQYLLRTHFCDIASHARYELYFNIYINGLLAYENFDISAAVPQLAMPYYIDFIVDTNPGLRQLTFSVGPSELSGPSVAAYALLNGLELMRMNWTAGGMTVDIPRLATNEDVVMRGLGEFARSAVCGLGIAALSVFLFLLVVRLQKELAPPRTHAGWSPVPTVESLEVKTEEAVEIPAGKAGP